MQSGLPMTMQPSGPLASGPLASLHPLQQTGPMSQMQMMGSVGPMPTMSSQGPAPMMNARVPLPPKSSHGHGRSNYQLQPPPLRELRPEGYNQPPVPAFLRSEYY